MKKVIPPARQELVVRKKGQSQKMNRSTLIKNGTIMDGTGRPGFRGDLLIVGDRIKAIGILNGAKADRFIDAQGLAVAPGFIDCHTHLDFFMTDPCHATVMERWCRQGVTTIIAGNCGFSPAPVAETTRSEWQIYCNFAMPRKGMTYEWTSMAEYFEFMERNKVSFNIGVFTGHNVLRANTMGFENRFAGHDELDDMKRQLKAAMDAGALGLSLGLLYLPAYYSDTAELVELASVLTEYGAPLAVHTRGLTQLYDKAVEEAILVAEKNRIPLQLSHHAGGDASTSKKDMMLGYTPKVKLKLAIARMMGEKFFLNQAVEKNPVRQKAVQLVQEALDRGVEIGHDNMPWMCGPSTILCTLPPWLFNWGTKKAFEQLQDPFIREKAAKEMASCIPQWPPWEHDYWVDNFFAPSMRLSGFRLKKNKAFENMSINRIARSLKKNVFDTVFDLIIEEQGRFFIIGGLFDNPAGDTFMSHLLKDPNCAIMTDVVGVDYTTPNPVSYGAFTKVLGQFARDMGVFSQEEAVRRMTALPAKQMQLRDRGRLKKGAYADICVFNPKTVKNKASFKKPNQFSDGINYVFINGTLVLNRGEYDHQAWAGRVLRRR